MRICVITWSNRKAGGVETYLENVILALSGLGHSLSLLHEGSEPTTREEIVLPRGTPSWCVSDMGRDDALAALREWKSDLIYAHGLLNHEIEVESIGIAPSVFLAHGYHGTCISGAKTFKSPVVKPCQREFGWQCLVHYFPHRCGGLSPLTMWNDFQLQSRRLGLLRSYDAVITLSEHMRNEYLKHGIDAECAWVRSDSLLHVGELPSVSDSRLEQRSIEYFSRNSDGSCLWEEWSF